MRPCILTAVLALATLLPWSQAQADSSQQAHLDIDGERYTLTLGEETAVSMDGKVRRIKVTLDPFRLLREAGIQLKFPAGMFLARDDSTPGLTIWTMNGDSAILMVQAYSAKISLEDILAETRATYASMNAPMTEEPVQMKTAGGLLNGQRLKVDLVGIRLVQELYAVDSLSGGQAIVLMLQDAREENVDQPTEEFQALAQSVADSFQRTE